MPKTRGKKHAVQNKKQAAQLTKQPNFTKIFFDTFGPEPKKVTYIVRHYPNRRHDLVFLGSLIHDACFKIKNITQKNNKLVIPISRDCWELPMKKGKSTIEPHIADAKLSISPVQWMECSYKYGTLFDDKKELMIQSIWLDQPDDEGNTILTIDSWNWKLRIKVNDDELQIILQDSEIPYLFSEKSKRKRKLTS